MPNGVDSPGLRTGGMDHKPDGKDEFKTQRSPRVFISYSHDSEEHRNEVRAFATFLRAVAGIDVHLDQWVGGGRVDWSIWAMTQMQEADFVLIIASAGYKRRADDHNAEPDGRGARFEAAIIRDNLTRDLPRETKRILPVLLPGHSADEIPLFLNAHSTTRYQIAEFTIEGCAELIKGITGISQHPSLTPGGWPRSQRATAPRSHLLTVTLTPISCSSNIKMAAARIDGMDRANSIVFRPTDFANEPHGVVEYNLGRRYRRFESAAGVLDDTDCVDRPGLFRVFLDGVAQPQFNTIMSESIWIQHDVTNVLRLRLVAWTENPVQHPAASSLRSAASRSGLLPSLAWGDPTLIE
ncbi:SEFIR domain-containing protein [Amycolatopsis sp. NPDC051045]|uniref:SEFIR domain-containing protein n=1 Tax=Amycolatopsis sp. NPDC051045 TaxID=3156922 RepID=UPI0034311EA2